MTDGTENQNFSESVEELRIKLEEMKKLIENEDLEEERVHYRRKEVTCRATIIDGNFLSIVFIMVLFLIICVSIYAFFNLFVALRKKYPGQHSEL